MGYLIGLHTAGIVPRRLEQVLPLVDWVSMDVKSSWKDHARVTRVDGSERRAQASVQAILRSGVAREFHSVGNRRFDLD